jgi:hypothetical protein
MTWFRTPEERAAARATKAEQDTRLQAEREYAAACAHWQFEHDRLAVLHQAAAAAAQWSGDLAYGVVLRKTESALWAVPAALIEPRRMPGTYVGQSAGVSVRIVKGVWVRSGGYRGRYIPGPELQTPIDNGHAVITTSRVVFTGQLKTREWQYNKLVSFDTSFGDAALIHVSNRQKVSGLLLGVNAAAFDDFFGTALAIHRSDATTVAGALQAALASHRTRHPRRPLPQ